MMRLIYIVLLIIIAVGCDRVGHDSRLEKINAMMCNSPHEALRALDSLSTITFPEKDRQYFNLLCIKAQDKTYRKHTSDSLIQSVIRYAAANPEDGIYPEALYYGGRVYRDLGDYPTALDYFHKALDLLPPDTNEQKLRSLVISQTGGLLNVLRLYDEAIPYIKESIESARDCQDSVGEVYDLQLLGLTYLRANKLHEADSSLHLALAKCKDLDSCHTAKTHMLLARVKSKLGELDSAYSMLISK